MTINRSVSSLIAIVAFTAWSPHAFAQAATAAPAPASADATTDADAQLGDIVVTGEKREGSIQKAPLAITAIQADALTAANITQVSQLDGTVPSLVTPRNGTPYRVISIRGIGSEATQTGSQPSVAYHIDGIYIGSPIATGADLLDVARVEVLRGPQGTIFGQAATGGAMNVISNLPELKNFTGYAELAGGNYDYFRGTAVVNVPISDTFAVRVAGQRLSHDGYATLTTGYKEDDADRWNGRISALWQPTDNFSAVLRYQHFSANEAGSAQKNILDPNPDPRTLTQDYPGLYKLQFDMVSAELKLDLPFATLKSTTSYQHMRNDNHVDRDRLNTATIGYYDAIPLWLNRYRAITQELNLSSPRGNRLEWTAGLYYVDYRETQNFVEFAGGGANPSSFDIPASAAGGIPSSLIYRLDVDLKRKTYAAFGQAIFHVTDNLRLTGGLRYNRDELESYSLTLYGLYAPGELISQRDNHVTGRAVVEYDVAPHNMLYASFSKGYKPGGANLITGPLLNSKTYKAEDLDAFEIGSKNRFFDDAVSLNLAGFFYKYNNLQFQQEDPIPYQGGIANIPGAHIWGVEAEASWKATRHLRFDGNVTHLDGEFTQNYFALDAAAANSATQAAAALGYGPFDAYTINLRAQQVKNLRGGTPPKLPAWSFGVSATHTADIFGGELTSRAEWNHRGSYIYRVFNAGSRDVVPSYDVVNISFTFAPANSHVEVGVAASNLFDKAGINSRYTDPFGSFFTSNEYIAPRQVVASVKYSF
ncbi:TonB-dependent receptor [soil metagenome]